MKVQVMQVTPELAQQFLMKNENNRSLKPSVVARYAKAMTIGAWPKTHQGIAFYTDGTLADGQHRLSAIVKSNVTLEMVVAFDVEKSAGVGIDCNAPRAQADVLRLSGNAWADKKTVAIAAMVLNPSGQKATNHELASLSDYVSSAVEFSDAVMGHSRTRVITSAPVKAALALALIGGVPKCHIESFAKVLKDGINQQQGDITVIVLRNYLISKGRLLTANAGGRNECLRQVQGALRTYLKGVDAKKLHMPDSLIWSMKAGAA